MWHNLHRPAISCSMVRLAPDLLRMHWQVRWRRRERGDWQLRAHMRRSWTCWQSGRPAHGQTLCALS